jgi:hypothetical protein
MTNCQYKTIYANEVDKYPNWDVVSRYVESARTLICERSDLPIKDCEKTECSDLKTHKTRSKVTEVEKAVIRKTESLIVP